MHKSYLKQKLCLLNGDLKNKFELAFEKDKHLSSVFIGERTIKSKIGSRVSFFPSIKNKGTISLESNLELAHAIELERNEDILRYKTQAVKIFLSENHYIIPDFIVKKLDCYEVHEIKPNKNHLSNDIINRFNLAKELLLDQYIIFKIYDEESLINQNELINLISSYQRIYNINFDRSQILNVEKILKGNEFKNKYELIVFLKTHSIPENLADYFIFYKKVLGV